MAVANTRETSMLTVLMPLFQHYMDVSVSLNVPMTPEGTLTAFSGAGGYKPFDMGLSYA